MSIDCGQQQVSAKTMCIEKLLPAVAVAVAVAALRVQSDLNQPVPGISPGITLNQRLARSLTGSPLASADRAHGYPAIPVRVPRCGLPCRLWF